MVQSVPAASPSPYSYFDYNITPEEWAATSPSRTYQYNNFLTHMYKAQCDNK